MEREVSPQLPTSGQIFGALVKKLGVSHVLLQSRTARRFFSGRMEHRVKESTRGEIIEAIAEVLADVGLAAGVGEGDDSPAPAAALADLLDWHAVNWERWRNFMRPRMMRVLPPHLPTVWAAYLRLAAVDLALRIAAQVQKAGAPAESLDFLEWAGTGRRGRYLNRKRIEAGLYLYDFAESVGVTVNAAEAWVYRGARPSDGNLGRIAAALSAANDPSEGKRMLHELRRLYWISDVAGLLEEFIGSEAVDDILVRLKTYPPLAWRIIDDRISGDVRADVLTELASRGTNSSFARSLLAGMARHESDGEWQEDLKAAGSDWIRRILAVNLRVHQAEENDLIRESEGRLLEHWDVGNPEAYAHYQRSMELQIQGRIHEAVAEVARAAELDPLDPANHFTLGSVKSRLGLRTGDTALVKEGLEACWLAASLDPNWILPWAEIGLILLENGKAGEAVAHLRAVPPERRPFDSRYFTALGAALRAVGDYAESLRAFESSLELDPEDPAIVEGAAIVAALAGDNSRSTRYFRMARQMGGTEELGELLDRIRAAKSAAVENVPEGTDGELAALNDAVRRNPESMQAYLRRGMAFFVREEDDRAVADLDAALRLDPSDAGLYRLRGIVCGYLKRFDRVVADMSEAIRLNPGDAEAYYRRGMAHGDQDQLDLAIADLDEAILLDPGLVDAYRTRGDCRRYRREYDLAISDYEAALRIDPEHALSLRGRGVAHRMQLDFDLAIADYDGALRLDPHDPLAHRFRGDAHLGKGDFELAVSDFDVALGFNAADGVAYRGRGSARLLNGEFDLAIADFNAALECDPGDARTFYGRGLAQETKGDADGAEEDYRRARELGYDDAE